MKVCCYEKVDILSMHVYWLFLDLRVMKIMC